MPIDRNRGTRQDLVFVAVILLPLIILVGILIYFPAIDSLITSFTNENLRIRRLPKFIGLKNYSKLIENSEFNLYSIHQELSQSRKRSEIIPKLATVTNLHQINKVISENQINTIFHAAAYKHVPMVEMNISEGVYNNVIGTYNVAKAALATYVRSLGQELYKNKVIVTGILPGGFIAPGNFMERFKKKTPVKGIHPATGEASLSCVFVELDDRTGLAKSIKQIITGGSLEKVS